MNNIFRVVWSQATQSWVAVSELTRAHKKQSSTSSFQGRAVNFSFKFFNLSLLSSMLFGASAGCMPLGRKQVVLLQQVQAPLRWTVALQLVLMPIADSTAIQRNAKASGAASIAIGNQANAIGVALGENTNTVAIGKDANASGELALAVGDRVNATGKSSFAFGREPNAKSDNSIAFGTAAGKSNIATSANDTILFGRDSAVHGANTNGSIVIGQGSFVYTGSGNAGSRSVAIGSGARSGTSNLGRDGVSIGVCATSGVGLIQGTASSYSQFIANSGVAIGARAMTRIKADLSTGRTTGLQNSGDVEGVNSINTTLPTGAVVGDYTSNNVVLMKAFVLSMDQAKTYIRTAHTNDQTGIGTEVRALEDQAVAIGAQTIAGDIAIAIGGNDINSIAGKKYKIVNMTSGLNTINETDVDDYQLAADNSTTTVTQQYRDLVERALSCLQINVLSRWLNRNQYAGSLLNAFRCGNWY